MADGYINHKTGQVILCSALVDRPQLNKFASFVKSNVREYKQSASPGFSTPTNKTGIRVAIQHKNIVQKIISKFDFRPQKTYNPPDIEKLASVLDTKEKFLAFFVGFVDGDGCILKKYDRLKVENHASWIHIHEYFVRKIKEFGIYNGIVIPKINKNGYSFFSLGCIGFLLKLKNEVDKINIPKMERKWKI